MRLALVLVASLLISGCISFPPSSSQFEAKQIETKALFPFAVWEKTTIQKGRPLHIYFEGDGDPNPYHKVAFDFAQQDPTSNVVYVARPCQWVDKKICSQKPQIYKEARFHPEIMREMKELTEYLIRKHQASSVTLIGYDGGAVIALNMASQLPINKVITIAGITDILAYNTYHNLPEIDPDDLENPVDNLDLLEQVPQVHYVGKDDEVTPRRLVERFVSRMKNPKSAVVKVVPGTGHTNWEGVKLDY